MNKNGLLGYLWVWWGITTAVYLLFNYAHYPNAHASILGYVAGFVGLFVPYGALSFLLLFTPQGMFSVVVFIIAMFVLQGYLNKQNYSLEKSILMNLLTLFILTTIVDIIRGTAFQSWIIFLNGSVRLGILG